MGTLEVPMSRDLVVTTEKAVVQPSLKVDLILNEGAIIGRGSTSTVFKAACTFPDGEVKDVAVKLYNPKNNLSKEQIARIKEGMWDEYLLLQRESLRLLDGNPVAPVPYGFIDTQMDGVERYGIVMELLPGETLEQSLMSGISTETAIDISGKLLRLVATLEEDEEGVDGLLLMDLTPKNIMYDHVRGIVRLIDFGQAVQKMDIPQQAISGVVEAAPICISPEEWLLYRNDLESITTIDERINVYKLGIILWQLVTGIPTSKATDNFWSLEGYHGFDEFINYCVSEGRTSFMREELEKSKCSNRLADVIMQAVSIDGNSRYPSTKLLLEAFLQATGESSRRRLN